ncbi:MAG: TRAP transporter TatT component family protein [Candidatus Omnitrophica bacterium]|nr:TRAP transporter TatT component family protein [Candidatus Omnitrophota bacterium]
MAILTIVIFLFTGGDTFALDWRRLHAQADKNTLEQIKADLGDNPSSVESSYTLALIYLNLHRDQEAEDTFRKISGLRPQLTEAKWGLAEVARRKHRHDASQKALNEIIQSDPGFYPAYISLAYLKYSLRDFQGALELSNKIIKQGQGVDLSNRTRAYLISSGAKGMLAYYGGILSKLVHGTVILRNLRIAEKLSPGSAEVQFGLGSFYLLAPPIAGGSLNKAQAHLEAAIKADPFLADAHVRLAQVYKLKGDRPKYDMYLNQALSIDPGNELALDNKQGLCNFICPGGMN